MDPLHVIADEHSGEDQRRDAMLSLGPAAESPDFWSRIANDASFSRLHRRRSIFQLFLRHVRPGQTLAAVADILRKPSWLEAQHVSALEDVGGNVPVRMSFDNTVLVLDVLPEPTPNSDRWQVFLSVTGAVDPEDFFRLVSGGPASEATKSARVVEIGFSPPVKGA